MDTGKTCYLFFDFDGTITLPGRPAGRIPREHAEALLRAQRMGHKLILCTGRSWGFLQTSPTYRRIPWDGIIVGGADIIWKGKQIYHRAIDPESVLRLAEYGVRLRARITLEGVHSYEAIDCRKQKGPLFDRDRERYLARVRRFVRREEVTKMSILRCRPIIPAVRAEFLLHNRRFGEFGPEGCTKGKAIRILCKRLGAPLSQCIVFGDSLNDLSMFETVGTSVCMSHSPKALVAAASYSAEGKYGVAEGISHYFGEGTPLTNGEK